MTDALAVHDTFVSPAADDVVSFVLVCRPPNGAGLDAFRERLALDTLDEFLPPEDVKREVSGHLRRLGFTVFDDPGPVVSAQGTVALFRSVFQTELLKRLRTVTTDVSSYRVTTIVLKEGSEPIPADPVPGALFIAVMSPPLFVAPSIPPATSGFNLHLPGDIAQLTRASAAHREATASGERATGAGVSVAVVDTGFAQHAFLRHNGYRITRQAAADASAPSDDPEPHGTFVLAGVLACAPDANVFGIKMGPNPVLALDRAMAVPGVKVISISWVHDLAGEVMLPYDLIPLRVRILSIVGAGVTVIAAAGNGQVAFPAMMPEVIAVGGVDVDESDKLSAWAGASSFASPVYPGRQVPDICGIASQALLPVPGAPSWIAKSGGTSCATPQVAGVAALLLQKTAALTPEQIRAALVTTATDVTTGTTVSGDVATKGADLATGAGLVNALAAWKHV